MGKRPKSFGIEANDERDYRGRLTKGSHMQPNRRQIPPKDAPKVRATLYISAAVLDEARNAAVHLAGNPLRLTLTKLAEDALRAELQRLKDRYNGGQDFPDRTEDLKGGRPIAA